MKRTIVLFVFYLLLTGVARSQSYPVVFDFEGNKDTQSLFEGTLQNGASLTSLGSYGVLGLGASDGYFDLGSDFAGMVQGLGSSFTVSVNLFVPTGTDISGNGNFIWCFCKSNTEGYMFLNAKDLRYAITQSTWTGETSVNAATALPEGRWVNVMYVQNGAMGSVYLDNELKAQNTSMETFPSDLTLTHAWLGRSPYTGDAYLTNARYADFRVYNTALGDNDRAELVCTVNVLNRLEDGIETEADAVAFDMDAVHVPLVAYQRINLPTIGEYGTTISWSSSDTSHLLADGTVVSQETDRDITVTLTATFTLGSVVETKTYPVKVKQKETYCHYLFAFFPSNSDENIYFAVGDDGYNFTTINNDQAVFLAQGHTVMGGLRDPHILRGEDGNFYMVATDMRSALGWASNRGMVLMKSSDLINWTCSTVHFPTKYAGTYLEHVTRVWAPETIYDRMAGKYMIYFSILTDDGTVSYDKVFYAYANADFTDLDGEPVYFYDRGSATIDMDIVYNEADGLYHAFYKNEGSGGICKVTAPELTPPQWENPSGRLEQTNVAVEGAGVFRLINDDNWILMYDCYGSGYYQFCSSPNLTDFTWVKNTTTSGSFTPRHGTVLPITEEEYQALLTAFPSEEITGEIMPDEQGNLNLTADRIPRLCESTDGWTSVSGFGILSSTANYSNGKARINGTFMERWRDRRSIGANSATKTLRYLPVGTYKLRGSCIASWQPDASVTVSGVTFYCDDQTADVHTADGVPERYTFTFDIGSTDDYSTTFGVETSNATTANWVAFDNFRLYYVGTEAEFNAALRQMHLDYIVRAEALYDDLCVEYLPALQAAVAAVNPDATDYTTIELQLDRLVSAIQTAEEQIASTVRLKETDIAAPAAQNGAHVKFCRSFFTEYWNTLVLPFSMTATQVIESFGEGTVVKELESVTGSENLILTFKTVETITANVPIIIIPGEVKEFYCIKNVDVNPSNNPATVLSLLSFVGNYNAAHVLTTDDYYLLDNYFKHSPGGNIIKPYRAYFHVADSQVKSLGFDDNSGDIPTAINDKVQGQEARDSSIYDLTGRRLNNLNGLPQGFYIIDGKKVVK